MKKICFKKLCLIFFVLIFSISFSQTRKGMRKSRIVDSHVATTWTNKTTGGLGLMFTPYYENDRQTNFDIRVNFIRDGKVLATDFKRYTNTVVPNASNRLGIEGYPTMLASNGTLMTEKDSVNVNIRMFKSEVNKLTAFTPYVSNAIPALPTSRLVFTDFPNIQQTFTPTESYGSYIVKKFEISKNMYTMQINYLSVETVDLRKSTNLRQFTARNVYPTANRLILPDSKSMLSIIYQNSTNFVGPIVNLEKQTELTSLRLDGLTNFGTPTIDVSTLTKLSTLLISSCGFSSLDLSNNPEMTILRVGRNVNITSPDLNNFSNGIIGLKNLTKLQEFYAGGSSLTNTLNLDDYPVIKTWTAFRSPTITYISPTIAKPTLTTLEIGESQTFEADLTLFKGLINIVLQNTNQKVIDLRQITHNSALTSNNVIVGTTFADNAELTNIMFKPNQTLSGALQIVGNPKLSSITFPTIQQTSLTGLFIYNNNFSDLPTSHANGTLFPNITSLGIGGNYTTSQVYESTKNQLTTIIVKGTKFIVDGEITTLFPVAQHLEIEGDANISYTNRSHVFPRMTRVYLRPKIGSGLNTSSAQIDALIQDLSKTDVAWTTSTSTLYIGGTNYVLQKVIDLRGNCAPATRGDELTQAINRLTAKGVTLLYN